MSTRIELRNPDPACNPYLAFAMCIKAGLEGIKNKISPGESTDKNIFNMTDEERINEGIESLPENLLAAIECLKNSSLARETLGEHVFNKYLEAKKIEWDNYKTKVHKWEIDEYLMKY
jgi:glutamine synthetase